jgi:hypothetical protein
MAGGIGDVAGDFPLLHVHYSWRLATVQAATLPCAPRRPVIKPQLHAITLANSREQEECSVAWNTSPRLQLAAGDAMKSGREAPRNTQIILMIPDIPRINKLLTRKPT